MKYSHLSFTHAVFAIVGILFLSGCNGEKLDSSLIDSITGKVPVEKITIDQEDFEMTEGESAVLTATVLPFDATDKTVSWNSSKEDVVMISNTGKAMAMAPGKSVITAKAGNKTDFITITVIANAVRVTGVSLDKTTLELKVDDSETLTATVTPDNATNKNVSWTSSDAAVATVENGKVTGVKPGSVTITAKTEDGGMTAECAVTVKTNLAPSVTVGPENVSAVSVVMKGKANLDSSAPSDLMVGFQYSLSEGILPSNSTTVEATDADSQYNYSRGITGLEPGTTYYFRSIVRMSGQDYYGETKSFTTKVLSSMLETKDASDITPTSAKTNAKLDLTDVQSTTMEYGFYWGTSKESQPTYVEGGEIAENAYSALLSGLSPTSQYWYKSYLKIDDQTFFGEVKVLSTDVMPVTSVYLDKTACTVHTIDSTFALTPTVLPEDATNKAVRWDSSNPSVATVDDNGKVTAKGNGSATITVTTKDQSKPDTCAVTVAQWVTGIPIATTSLVLVEGQSETLSVTISPENANDKSVTWSSSDPSVATVDQSGKVRVVSSGVTTIMATANDGSGKSASNSLEVAQNLSVNASANCYIVSSAGAYYFQTTQGNSSTSVGDVSSVDVLWESFGTSTTPSVGSIINIVSYSSNAIIFSTPSTLKNGNAVIAAKNSSGTILWSWHIWVCDGFDPESTAQVYYNDAGTMMDRNLGATSATPGDVGALGLLYQWGRKDPFLGSSSISSNTKAASTLSWPSPVETSSSKGTVTYAVKNPTTFIKASSSTHYDWCDISSNTRWQSNKTIYDPCPPGWRVPDGGYNSAWTKAVNSSSFFSYTWDDTKRGINFSGKFGIAETIWYPAAGYLYGAVGSLEAVGHIGEWWSCVAYGYKAYILYLNDNGRICPSYDSTVSWGHSVRCQKE